MIEMTVAGSIWASSVAFVSTVAASRFRSSGRTRTPDTLPPMPESVSPVLSQSQLETLAELGVEATAEPGKTLYEIGDESYPFIAILEGEVAITNMRPAARSSATARRASSVR